MASTSPEFRCPLLPLCTYYKRALQRVLYAARLKAEVRIDEKGNPFLWIARNPKVPSM